MQPDGDFTARYSIHGRYSRRISFAPAGSRKTHRRSAGHLQDVQNEFTELGDRRVPALSESVWIDVADLCSRLQVFSAKLDFC